MYISPIENGGFISSHVSFRGCITYDHNNVKLVSHALWNWAMNLRWKRTSTIAAERCYNTINLNGGFECNIHSKPQKNDNKKLLGICLKKVKQKLPSHFQKFAHSSQRKRSLSSTALALVFWYPQLDLPSLVRRSSSSMVQLGAVSVASLIEMSMTLDQIHLWFVLVWLIEISGGKTSIPRMV